MCRWIAYTGDPILLGDLLLKPKHNLIDQSLHSDSINTPTNGDGFGLGWYDHHQSPGLFRSIRPAWNDLNLKDLAYHIDSHLFLAHIRAASLANIQETNCHPFRYKNWLFMHNGQIAKFELIHQKLLSMINPVYFNNIAGSTDSEVMFHLALTLGLERDVPTAIAEMVRVIERTAKEYGVNESLWMTLGISDGKNIWGFRYGSNGKGPSLYISPSMEELSRLNPHIGKKFGENAACLVSEPIGDYADKWKALPENSMIVVSNRNKDLNPISFKL